MSQLNIVEDRLTQTSNLALDQYSKTNIPLAQTRKETHGNDPKLIKSEFTHEFRPIDPKLNTKSLNQPPPVQNYRQPVHHQNIAPPPIQKPLPPPIFNNPAGSNPIINPELNLNQQLPPPTSQHQHQQKKPPIAPNEQFGMKPAMPGDFRFYSTVKQATPQNYPRSGMDKLMSDCNFTMRPILHTDEEGTCLRTISTLYIYPGSHSREHYSMEPMFVVSENTNSCAKHFLTTDCRPFEVTVSHDVEGQKEFLHMERDCNVNCFCMGRPEMLIDFTEEGSKHPFEMGGIYHPFVFCDYELEAYNGNGQTLFVISAERCACNIYCCFGCKSCNRSVFTIRDIYENTVGAIEIGTHYQSCLPGTHECDYFSLNFAPFLGPNERILLLSAMIFISTRLFSRGFGTNTILE